ncbi:hypothetical protein Ciccas_009197 [Cichlidogyrus casuarinus]|uniref:Uncharacterized protein n=1 Tax=Cichlidogyrus casuarinus TaxID=1844966 RepID=A0ABD2PXS1_9PLAT
MPHSEDENGTYWTVSAANRGLDKSHYLPTSHDPYRLQIAHEVSPSVGTSGSSSRRESISLHSKIRNFLTENWPSRRVRTKSDQAALKQQILEVVNQPSGELPTTHHAFTITSGSGAAQTLLKELHTENAKFSAVQALPVRSTRLFKISSVKNADDPLADVNSDIKRRVKDSRSGLRIRSTKSNTLSQSTEEDDHLPDPAKLPKEDPNGSLQFTRNLTSPKKKNVSFHI